MSKKTVRNIMCITYWSFKDALVQTYTLPYLRIIKRIISPESKIYLVTFESSKYKMAKEEWLQQKSAMAKEGIELVSFRYSNIGLMAMLRLAYSILYLTLLCFRKGIGYIHAWCTPAGTIGYILSLLTDKQLIIDSYEPHAESMVENGTWKREDFAFKTLLYFEKKQSERAIATIGLSAAMPEYSWTKYKVKLNKFYIKPACVNFDQFKSQGEVSVNKIKESNGLTDKIVCVYAGKTGGIYLEQEIFDFFKACYEYWGEKFRVLMLTATPQQQIAAYCKNSQLPAEVLISKFVNHTDVPAYLSVADFALNPVKPVPSKRYCTSIKDGEYWAMGLPVVITPNISDDSAIIEANNAGAILKGFSTNDYLEAIRQIDQLLKTNREELTSKIISLAKKYRNFEIAEKVYSEIYSK